MPQLARLMGDLIARGKIASDSNIWFVDDGSKDGTWRLIESLIGIYYVMYVVRSRARLDPPLILKIYLLSVLMTPFFLPKMHERLFSVADVTEIAYAFYFPRQYAKIMVSFASFYAYLPSQFGYTLVPPKVLPIVTGTALVLVATSTKKSLDEVQVAAA